MRNRQTFKETREQTIRINTIPVSVMQKAQSYPGVSLRDRSDERATLRELIDTCLRNCANSFRILSLEGSTESYGGVSVGATTTEPSILTYVSNVQTLTVHIPDSWKTEPIKTHERNLRPADGGQKTEDEAYWIACDLHHAIIQMLIDRRELAETKMPRSLVD